MSSSETERDTAPGPGRGLLSAGVLVGAVVTHRPTRLASRESVRRYYGRFALAH